MYNKQNLVAYILDKLDQVKIMAYLLDISVGEIEYCLTNKNKRLHSTLRSDNTPSVGFYWQINIKGIKLKCIDYARPEYSGDIFDMAIRKLQLPNTKCTFPKICEFIIDNYDKFDAYKPRVVNPKSHAEFELKPMFRELNQFDLNLWNSWGISQQGMIATKIYPISNYIRDGRLINWESNNEDPGYAYYIDSNNIDHWKLYFPLRSKTSQYKKHLTNSFSIIDGYDNKQKGNILFIMKSKKELAMLVSHLLKYKIEIPSVTFKTILGESIILPNSTSSEIQNNFRRTCVMFDNDEAGLACTERFSVIKDCLSFTHHIPYKDLTDSYVKNKDKTATVINRIINTMWKI